MRNYEPIWLALTLSAIYFLVLPQSAYAYLDPGSGSLIWQLLIAVILSISVVIGSYWRKIRCFFTRGDRETTLDTDDDHEEP